MKARRSKSTRCDIRKGEVCERSSATIQTHGILIPSRKPSKAKNEDRHKGLEIGKHKLGIITTLDVAGELRQRTRQENRAASMEAGDSVDTSLFLLFDGAVFLTLKWEIGTALPAKSNGEP